VIKTSSNLLGSAGQTEQKDFLITFLVSHACWSVLAPNKIPMFMQNISWLYFY